MAGTISGGKKCAATNKAKYGKDWYAKIGALGGKAGNTGGFHANPELAREAGRKGGLVSKRGKSLKTVQRVEKARKMHAAGATREKIANELNISVSTVDRYLYV